MDRPTPAAGSPAEVPPPARPWLRWMLVCAIVGLAGAFVLDRYLDRELHLCSASVLTDCLTPAPVAGEHWTRSFHRHALDSDSALRGVFAVVRVSLIVLFAVGTLELLMEFFRTIGTPGFRLQEIRKKLETMKKGGAARDGGAEPKPPSWAFTFIKEIVLQPQFLIPVTAVASVTGGAAIEVIKLSPTDDARIPGIEKVVGDVRTDLLAMHDVLVTVEDGKRVPRIAPRVTAALDGLATATGEAHDVSLKIKDKLDATNYQPSLDKLLAGLGSNGSKLDEVNGKLPSGNFSTVLARMDRRVAAVDRKLGSVESRQQAQGALLVGVDTKVERGNRNIETIRATSERTDARTLAMRKTLGKFPGNSNDPENSVVGELKRLVNHETFLAERWLRVFPMSTRKNPLRKPTDQYLSTDESRVCSNAEATPEATGVVAGSQ